MIVDTSALIAILFEDAEDFARLILEVEVCRISVANRLELTMVLERQAKSDTVRQAEAFPRAAAIIEEPVTLDQGLLARQAFYDFGRGRHRARLTKFRRLFCLRVGESDGRAAPVQRPRLRQD